MGRKSEDDGTIKCTNRLLLMIFLSITIQTFITCGVGIGLYIAYDNHRSDLNELGSVPWGDMANDLKSQYLNMDKNALNDIIKNSKNITHKANLLVHTHVETLAEDVSEITGKVKDNTDLFDVARVMMYDLKKPIAEAVKLIDHKNTMDLKEMRSILKKLVTQMDAIQINKLIVLIEDVLQGMKDNITPETISDIVNMIDKLNKAFNNKNTKLVHDLAEDADNSVKSINKLFSLFESVKKTPV